MANRFGTDIILRTPNPKQAAAFYVQHLGFAVTEESPEMISIRGENLNLFIERGPAHGPVLEVLVDDVEAAKRDLLQSGGQVLLEDPAVPRIYVRDPYGLAYNLATALDRD